MIPIEGIELVNTTTVVTGYSVEPNWYLFTAVAVFIVGFILAILCANICDSEIAPIIILVLICVSVPVLLVRWVVDNPIYKDQYEVRITDDHAVGELLLRYNVVDVLEGTYIVEEIDG